MWCKFGHLSPRFWGNETFELHLVGWPGSYQQPEGNQIKMTRCSNLNYESTLRVDLLKEIAQATISMWFTSGAWGLGLGAWGLGLVAWGLVFRV